MKHKILIVDDEPNVRLFLSELLSSEEDYIIETASNGARAMSKGKIFLPDVIFLDLRLPDANGLDLIKTLKVLESYPQIIIISALGTVENAVSATQLGAFDFVTKPFDIEKITLTLKRCCEFQLLYRENLNSKECSKELSDFQEFIGETQEIKKIKKRILKLKNTDVPILITGETGTGKNILAKQIHQTIAKEGSPLVYINCSTISENLFESELFGHEKGSFTGAVERKTGRIEDAEGGSVILDEISEIPYNLQAKLLTFLQEKTFFRVGGGKEIKINTRIIALSNCDLLEEIERNNFRKDLYYRLDVIHFTIPPLRERRDDIALLCRHFLGIFYKTYGGIEKKLDTIGFEYLKNYSWPGNTRELKNVLERAFIYSDGDTLAVEEYGNSFYEDSLESNISLKERVQKLERQFIISILTEEGGNRKKTAERLKISLRALQYKIAEYEINQ